MPSYDDDRQSGRCYGWLCAVLGILAGVGALYGAYYYYMMMQMAAHQAAQQQQAAAAAAANPLMALLQPPQGK